MAAAKDRADSLRDKLQAELARRNMTYAQLAEELREIGIRESELSIAEKFRRGAVAPAFFAQCLIAIGTDSPIALP